MYVADATQTFCNSGATAERRSTKHNNPSAYYFILRLCRLVVIVSVARMMGMLVWLEDCSSQFVA